MFSIILSHGRTTAETALNTGCVSAFRKTWDGENAIVLMNLDSQAAQTDLSGYADWELAAALSATGEEITLADGTLNLPAWGTAVLVPAK